MCVTDRVVSGLYSGLAALSSQLESTYCNWANRRRAIPTGVATPLSFWHETLQSADGWIGSLAQQLLGREKSAVEDAEKR